MSFNISELSGRKGLQDNLFDKLGKAANEHGSVPVPVTEELAQAYLLGKSTTYGAASFYDLTAETNAHKKVYVCEGSACLCAGTQSHVQQSLSKHFNPNEIGRMYCLGRCHEAAAFHFQGSNYSGKQIESFSSQSQQNTLHPSDTYHVAHSGTAILTQTPLTINDLQALLESLLSQTPEQILSEISVSGLRGRGGAGFPTAIKMESCKNTPSTSKYVVCNADEGDPGAYSDRYIMEQQTFRLLAGMLIAGYTIGAQWGVIYIRAEYPESIAICEDAIQKMYANQLLGDSIAHTNFRFHCRVIRAQGAYICGEETALLSSIEGQRPEVRVRPPYPAQVGLFNKPTIVQNVETIAALPFIIQQGGLTYASIGVGKSTGTKLISLDSFFNRPGIYEVDMGTTLHDVIFKLGMGFNQDIKALHIGGPLGGIVPLHAIEKLQISFESFQQNGFLLGHASVVSIPASFPMITYLHHLFEFTAHESCGKCFPCRLGSTRGKELFERAIHSNEAIDKTLLDDLLQTMEIGSLCALGGGLPLPIKNALQYFSNELQPYIQ